MCSLIAHGEAEFGLVRLFGVFESLSTVRKYFQQDRRFVELSMRLHKVVSKNDAGKRVG